MSIFAVFPGQGSQYLKMAKDFYDNFNEAKAVFDEVNESLNFNLSNIIFGESEDDLKQTQNTQPALMTVSIAIARVLESQTGFNASKTAFVAGHSLGEYSALCFAGSMSLSQTAVALKSRGESMAAATYDTEGSMAAIIGMDEQKIEDFIDYCIKNSPQGSVLVSANDNSVGQIVISGSKQAVDFAVLNAKSQGAKLATLLPVSGAFHSPLMSSATKKMQDVLQKIQIKTPQVPVIQNVNFTKVTDPEQIKQNLILQIQSPVKWRQTMLYAEQNGATKLIEIGAKNVLCGLCKRTTPSIESLSIEKIEDIKKIENLF
jgi:[acyl-carrier-protein] S-malonyltransferase